MEMIDRPTRDRYAELLRHFVAGQMTNFEYEGHFDSIAESLDISDPAVDEIFQAMWHTYCDLRKHKMSGRDALVGENRDTAARFILFLHSDLPYEWPTSSLKGCLLNLLTVGLYGKLKKTDPTHEKGEMDVWPFHSRTDCEQAKQNPRLMRAIANKTD
jgi:hypothetical protein